MDRPVTDLRFCLLCREHTHTLSFWTLFWTLQVPLGSWTQFDLHITTTWVLPTSYPKIIILALLVKKVCLQRISCSPMQVSVWTRICALFQPCVSINSLWVSDLQTHKICKLGSGEQHWELREQFPVGHSDQKNLLQAFFTLFRVHTFTRIWELERGAYDSHITSPNLGISLDLTTCFYINMVLVQYICEET